MLPICSMGQEHLLSHFPFELVPIFTFHVGVNILWSIWVSFRRVYLGEKISLVQYDLAKL